ncbi:hypothetical protein GA0061078_1419 [Bifidobacterium bohemicum]|uniref:Lipoprotein n=1 Tax=Bifidobacterium bohemicum DSM 22767 TaxID=1437606 RepID=A0A086ZGW0_9BIFI|nr:hypothetical protein BBOH_0562 [Bifidobacterium bohemicum DSM 22767]SCC08789.1 hypothetical protein GA0061078_1419 [Bifidobacterium bohemicum]
MKRRGGFARVVPAFLAVVALSVSGCANAAEVGDFADTVNAASTAVSGTHSQNDNKVPGGGLFPR